MKIFIEILRVIVELLYPNRCVFCEELCIEEVCERCKQEVFYVKEPRCKKCGKPIRYATQEYCYDCENTKKLFDVGRSLWVHKGVVADSLYRFKYHRHKVNGEFYARAILQKYATTIYDWEIDTIIPVPVHKKRQAKRGFNQSEIIAKCMSQYLHIPTNTTVVERVTHTKPQKNLSGRRRRQNLRGAFKVVDKEKVTKNILLIDDIYTTGSTLEEMASILKRAGARKVCFLTISIGQGI